MKFSGLLALILVTGLAFWSCETPTPPATYTVAYSPNGATGGTVPSDSGKYVSGATVTVAPNSGSLIRIGYSFVGWNLAADGSRTAYAEGSTLAMPASNLTLFASWSKALVGAVTPPGTFTVSITGPAAAVFGQEASFGVSYDGTASSYRWLLNGTPLPGATAATLVLSPTVSSWAYGANLLTLIIGDANGVNYVGNTTVTVGN